MRGQVCVLDWNDLVRLESADQLDALSSVHGDHDLHNGDGRASKVDQREVNMWVLLVNFLCNICVRTRAYT